MSYFSELTNEELLVKKSDAVKSGEDFKGYSEIQKRLLSGKMTLGEFNDSGRRDAEELYPKIVELFSTGDYFGCQGLDFLSHLLLTKEEIEKDQQRWHEFYDCAQAIHKLQDRSFLEIQAFFETRVEASFESRTAFLNSTKTGLKTDMSKEGQRGFFAHRKSFENESMRWGWSKFKRAHS
jgi:hypothetical protein